MGALLIGLPHLVLDVVGPDDFLDRRCAFVVMTAHRMALEGVPVDQITLPGFVRHNGLLDAASPRMLLASFLSEMVAAAPVPASGAWYAAQVVESAVRRRADVAGQRISRAAEDGALAELRRVLMAELAAVVAELDRIEVGADV